MHNFDRSVIETKNLVKTGIISASEFARLGLSDLHWALARKKKLVCDCDKVVAHRPPVAVRSPR